TLSSDELSALKRSNEDILERYPPSMMAPAIQRRLNRCTKSQCEPIRWWQHLAIGVPVAAAAALLMVVMPMEHGEHSADGTERLKGSTQLVVQRARADKSLEPLVDGSAARAGDRIQLGYRLPQTSDESVYGVVLSLDGAGSVTAHLPSEGVAPKLQTHKLVALPHSYVLDDAPRFERFFLITSRRPFKLEPILQAARELGKRGGGTGSTLSLESGVSQTSVLIVKE
ncbi:MAG: ActD-like protein, partial [Myxococcota bacterium]